MKNPWLFASKSVLTKGSTAGCFGILTLFMAVVCAFLLSLAYEDFMSGVMLDSVLFVAVLWLPIVYLTFKVGQLAWATAGSAAADVREAREQLVVREQQREKMAEQGGQLSVAEFVHGADGGLSEVVASEGELSEVAAEDDEVEEVRAEQEQAPR